jgi:hypothetical protein
MIQSLFADDERPLPDRLSADLEELLTWDNNCFLTWVRVGPETDPQAPPWFTVRITGLGRAFRVRLEFALPPRMTERGVAAILPAHLSVAECQPGKEAAVEWATCRWSELRASLPRLARTCARLMNELWGRTETDAVLLLRMDYQDVRSETPFPVGKP